MGDNYLFAKAKVTAGFSLLAAIFVCAAVSAAPWQGAGTTDEPYLISDADDLQAVGADPNYWDAHFKMNADIDLRALGEAAFNMIGYWCDGYSWYDAKAFTGVFDGDGHTVSNLTEARSIGDAELNGFFGYVGTSGEVKDLGLLDVHLEGRSLGSLVGYNEGTVSSCCAVGSVSGDNACPGIPCGFGGLVGFNAGTISNCHADVLTTGDGGVYFGPIIPCGGLAGVKQGRIVDSCATGSVEASYAGGLVGYNEGIIWGSYATGSVTGAQAGGGLVGTNFDGTISACYARGSVVGRQHVGGLVGRNGGRIAYSYGTGSVTGEENVGGLVGINCADKEWSQDDWGSGEIEVSFWDTSTSGIGTMCGHRDDVRAGCDSRNGRTTSEMQTMSTFVEAGWDFVGQMNQGPNDEWAMPDGGGYPILWWQLPEASLPPLPDFSGGSGVEDDPYIVADACDLNSIGSNPRLMDRHFVLSKDVDLANTAFFPRDIVKCCG